MTAARVAAIQAAKTVTQTVPIVMATRSDPVGTGSVASINRLETGLSLQTVEPVLRKP
jgi:ABC-type uncharacterized transport system substrate-binding protein